jgi:hypothetical protein
MRMMRKELDMKYSLLGTIKPQRTGANLGKLFVPICTNGNDEMSHVSNTQMEGVPPNIFPPFLQTKYAQEKDMENIGAQIVSIRFGLNKSGTIPAGNK